MSAIRSYYERKRLDPLEQQDVSLLRIYDDKDGLGSAIVAHDGLFAAYGPDPYAGFLQLLGGHLAGRIGERARRGLRLRESDNVAYALGSRHQHDQPVETERDAAVRSYNFV